MKLPFDEVYLLNLCEREDKYNRMRERIDYMGWDVKDFRVVKHPMSDIVVDNMGWNLCGKGFSICNGGVFNCTREEYTIIKSAYLRGLNTIGIIEDDCSFYKDLSVWEEYMNSLPEDWDILRINCLRGGYEEDYCIKDGKKWVRLQNHIYGTGFYVMNRKGMKYMIDKIDECYQPIDHPLYNYDSDKVNIYIPNIELSLCLEDSYESDIRGNASDNMFHNYYKDIKRLNLDNYI